MHCLSRVNKIQQKQSLFQKSSDTVVYQPKCTDLLVHEIYIKIAAGQTFTRYNRSSYSVGKMVMIDKVRLLDEINFEDQMCIGEVQLCVELWHHNTCKEQGWKRYCRKVWYSQRNLAWLMSEVILKLKVVYGLYFSCQFCRSPYRKKKSGPYVKQKTFWNEYAGSRNAMLQQSETILVKGEKL